MKNFKEKLALSFPLSDKQIDELHNWIINNYKEDDKESFEEECLNLTRRFYDLFPYSSHFDVLGSKGLRVITVGGLIREIAKYYSRRRND